jgi:hypothetical protein
LARRIAKLSVDGLKGIDTINCWISRRIQPLQHRDRLMHEYTGANDGMRCSDQELDPKVVEKRIRSLMKSPRKKPLEFGMAMFENGSCPLVSFLSATAPCDICYEITFFFLPAQIAWSCTLCTSPSPLQQKIYR